MGGNNSVSKQTTNIVNQCTLEVINESITNCKSTSKLLQQIKIVAGNNSVITLDKLRMSQALAVKIACMAKIQSNTSTINKLQTDLNNKISKLSEGIPEAQISSKKKQEIVNNVTNEIKVRSYIKNVINSIQSAIAEQRIDLTAGDSSQITISSTQLDNSMNAILSTIQENASTLVNQVLGNTAVTNVSEIADKPITAVGDAAGKVIDSAGNAAGKVIDSAGNAANNFFDSLSGMMMYVIIALIVIIVLFRKQIGEALGMASKKYVGTSS